MIAALLFALLNRPLVAVISEMQQSGMTIIYSNDLVKPSMRVLAEPRNTRGRALLDEILEPHGLTTKEVDGVISIVRASRRPTSLEEAPPISAPLPMVPVQLENIVVTASNYAALGGSPERRELLTRPELNRTAHLGDDLFRALSQLPGAASTDFSAAFGVRGGLPQETLVILDGLEIADPFHIKYFQNAISVIDSDAIGSLDYLSGGFPVEYGAMSAVIDMSTTTPQQARHTYAGVSFTHARLVSDGTFGDDRGRWLLSLRRGYFDILLGLFYADIDVRPRYGDVIGKLEYRIGDRNVLSANVLAAVDRIDYDDGDDIIDAEYNNAYGWLNLRTMWNARTSSQTVASMSRLRQEKKGQLDIQSEFGSVTDNRAFNIAALKQDWTYDRSDMGHLFKAGFDTKQFATRYDYKSLAVIRDPILRIVNPETRGKLLTIALKGRAFALYASDRVRLADNFAVEAGVRFEHENWQRGDAAISPRVNVVYGVAPRTAIRASWGDFRQAQRLDDIAIEDGDTATYPAQRSRQAELGVEHQFATGLLVRAVAYRKSISHVRPRYENVYDRDEFFPEVKYDRVRLEPDRSEATGVELLMKSDPAQPFTWWASASRSRSIDEFGDESVPRSWDQPLALAFNANYQTPTHWNLNLGGFFHSGWPTTRMLGQYQPFALSLGPRNRERLPAYYRVDARVMHSVPLRRGTFRSWLEVTNLLNRENACCVSGFTINVDNALRTVDTVPRHAGLGWLPSFGIAWEF